MIPGRRLIALLMAACVMPALPACSGEETGDTGGRAATSGLALAMASVSGRGPAEAYFEYGDTSRLRELGVVDPEAVTDHDKRLLDPKWSTVFSAGSGALGPYVVTVAEATAFNALAVETAMTIGTPPNTASKFIGSLHAGNIKSKLIGLGAKPRTFGTTVGLSFAGDNKIDVKSRITTQTNLVNQLNQIVVDDHRLAASPNATTLQKVVGGGASLLDTGGYRDLASCLGDVVAAIILTPAAKGNSQIMGVGLRDPSSATGTRHEVICALPAEGKKSAVHDAFNRAFDAKSVDPASNRAMSSYVTSVKVADTGDVVEATLTMGADAPVGYLITGIQRDLTRYWDGSCSATNLARHRC